MVQLFYFNLFAHLIYHTRINIEPQNPKLDNYIRLQPVYSNSPLLTGQIIVGVAVWENPTLQETRPHCGDLTQVGAATLYPSTMLLIGGLQVLAVIDLVIRFNDKIMKAEHI